MHKNWARALDIAGRGLVLDDDFPDGIASTLAQKLMLESSAKVSTMGLEERSSGFAKHLDNLPPSKEKIIRFIKNEKN